MLYYSSFPTCSVIFVGSTWLVLPTFLSVRQLRHGEREETSPQSHTFLGNGKAGICMQAFLSSWPAIALGGKGLFYAGTNQGLCWHSSPNQVPAKTSVATIVCPQANLGSGCSLPSDQRASVGHPECMTFIWVFSKFGYGVTAGDAERLFLVHCLGGCSLESNSRSST